MIFFNCEIPGISTTLMEKVEYLKRKTEITKLGWVWDCSTEVLNEEEFVILVRVIPQANFVNGTVTPATCLSSCEEDFKNDFNTEYY